MTLVGKLMKPAASRVPHNQVVRELGRAIRNEQLGYSEALIDRLTAGNKGFNVPRIKVEVSK